MIPLCATSCTTCSASLRSRSRVTVSISAHCINPANPPDYMYLIFIAGPMPARLYTYSFSTICNSLDSFGAVFTGNLYRYAFTICKLVIYSVATDNRTIPTHCSDRLGGQYKRAIGDAGIITHAIVVTYADIELAYMVHLVNSPSLQAHCQYTKRRMDSSARSYRP